MSETLIVNLYGGPGSGKSTMCAAVFAELKWLGINCEMALEFAKEKVWEGSLNLLDDQLYIFGKQNHKIHRLLGKVDVILTDSPLMLSMIYAKTNDDQRPHHPFNQLVMSEVKKLNRMNFFISRKKPYNPKGRLQSEEKAIKLDQEIFSMLENWGEYPYVFPGRRESVPGVVEKIMEELGSKSNETETVRRTYESPGVVSQSSCSRGHVDNHSG